MQGIDSFAGGFIAIYKRVLEECCPRVLPVVSRPSLRRKTQITIQASKGTILKLMKFSMPFA